MCLIEDLCPTVSVPMFTETDILEMMMQNYKLVINVMCTLAGAVERDTVGNAPDEGSKLRSGEDVGSCAQADPI